MSEREGHHYQPEAEVREGEGRDEPVLDAVQAVLRGDSDDDQHVTDNNNNHHDGDDDGENDDLGGGVLAGVAVGEVPVHHCKY